MKMGRRTEKTDTMYDIVDDERNFLQAGTADVPTQR